MTVTVVVDPADTSRAHVSRKTHLVLYGDRVMYRGWDRAEARVWADGFRAALELANHRQEGST